MPHGGHHEGDEDGEAVEDEDGDAEDDGELKHEGVVAEHRQRVLEALDRAVVRAWSG